VYSEHFEVYSISDGVFGRNVLLELSAECERSDSGNSITFFVYKRPFVPVDVSPDVVVLDFDGLRDGTIVNNQLNGVSISAVQSGDESSNFAMILDATVPSTLGFHELFFPDQNNVLIISANLIGLGPDDNDSGGSIVFDFPEASDVVDMKYFGFVTTGSRIDLFNVRDELISTVLLPASLDSVEMSTIGINTNGVKRMEIQLTGPGAIDDIRFRPSTNPCTSGYECVDGFSLSCDSLSDNLDDSRLGVLTELKMNEQHVVIVSANVTETGSTGDLYGVEAVCPAESCNEELLEGVLTCNETLLETTGRLDALPDVFNRLPECMGIDVESFASGGAYRIGVNQPNAGITLASHCIDVNSRNDVALLLYRRFTNVTSGPQDVVTLDNEDVALGIVNDDIPNVTVSGVKSDDSSANFAMVFDIAALAANSDLELIDLGRVIGISSDIDSVVPNTEGGTLTLEFDEDVDMLDCEVVDFGRSGTMIEVFDSNDRSVRRIEANTAENPRQVVEVNTAEVKRMEVTFSGAGALDNIRVQPQSDACVEGYECVDGYEFRCDGEVPLSNSISYDVFDDEDYLVVALGSVVDASNFGDSFSYDVDCRMPNA